MENRRILKNIIFITVLITSTFSFTYISAYSAKTTHPALTSEIVDLYNHHYSQTAFNDEEKQLIVQGSTDEDEPVVRVLNHFYDPVRNIGLLYVNVTAKAWAVGTRIQAAFSGNLVAGVSEPLFSEEDEYSWERSIYEYVHGDKNRALLGLGHTLHMIEDMAVPSHTRNDQHLSVLDESPYEKWTSKFTPESITTAGDLIAERKTPALYSSLGEYMDKVSMFTNSHFFSKDTLPFAEAEDSSIPEDRYSIPEYSVVGVGMLSSGEMQSFGMGKVDGVSYKLFELQEHKDIGTRKIIKNYSINSKNGGEQIMMDYWDILSKQAVLNGAGVIKLFFDEVEKEKETLALYNKNKSWLAKILPKMIAPKYTKGDLTPQQNLASVSTVFEEPIVEEVYMEPVQAKEPLQETVVETAEELIEESVEEVIVEEVVFDTEDVDVMTDEGNEWWRMKASTPYPGFGGDGGSSKAARDARETVEVEETVSAPDSPTISSPMTDASFATSSITFSGTASSTLVISQDFSSATTTADSDSNWSLTLFSFSQGTTTVAFVASDNNQDSESTSVDVFVDTVAPTIGNFAVLQCSYSLLSTGCLSGSTDVSLSWTSTSTDVANYRVVTDGAVGTTTTATSTSVTISDGSSVSLSVVAYDTVGNTATSSAQTVEVFEMPIVINEIAWAGTKASSADEWIELYNRTSYTLDLSNTVLYAEDLVPYLTLSNSIASGGYYLIERSNGSTTSEIEDLTVVFSGIGGGSGLSNSGEQLILVQSLGGNATTTLDSTPALSLCSGWCFGEATTTPISMERRLSDTNGTGSDNWGSNGSGYRNGTDEDGNAIYGTPKVRNSVTPPPDPPGFGI